MAQLWALVIVTVILVLFISLAFTWRHRASAHAVLGVGIAAVCGLAGAFLIVRREMDVIPDTVEGIAAAVLIVVGSLGLIMMTWLHWVRD